MSNTDFEAQAREVCEDLGVCEEQLCEMTQYWKASVCRSARALIKKALEEGRRRGLNEAAETAAKEYGFDSWDDENNASKEEQLKNSVGCHIASAIRKLIEKTNGP